MPIAAWTRAPQPEDEEDVEPALEELEQRECVGKAGRLGKSTSLRVLAGKPPEGHIPTQLQLCATAHQDFERWTCWRVSRHPPLAPVSPIISAGPKLGLVI